MSEKASQRCAGTTQDGFWSHRCVSNGKHEHEGKFYCLRHHPPTVAAKRAEKQKAWEERWEAKKAQWDHAAEVKRELERRAACYDDLLAALNLIAASTVEGGHINGIARTAIAKATGVKNT